MKCPVKSAASWGIIFCLLQVYENSQFIENNVIVSYVIFNYATHLCCSNAFKFDQKELEAFYFKFESPTFISSASGNKINF